MLPHRHRHRRRLTAIVAMAVLVSTSVALSPAPASATTCTSGPVQWTPATARNYFAGNLCIEQGPRKLTFQGDGNLVFYVGGVASWQSGTAGTGHRLSVQSDGRIVIYNASGVAKWFSKNYESPLQSGTGPWKISVGDIGVNAWSTWSLYEGYIVETWDSHYGVNFHPPWE